MRCVSVGVLVRRVGVLGDWWRGLGGRWKAVVLVVVALTATSCLLGWRVYRLTRPEPEFLCGHLPAAELVPIVGYHPRQDGPAFERKEIYSCTVESREGELLAQARNLLWESGTRSDLNAVHPPKEKLVERAAKEPEKFRVEPEVPGYPKAFLYTDLVFHCVYWVGEAYTVRACARMDNSASPDQEEHMVSQVRTLVLAHAAEYLLDQPTPVPTH